MEQQAECAQEEHSGVQNKHMSAPTFRLSRALSSWEPVFHRLGSEQLREGRNTRVTCRALDELHSFSSQAEKRKKQPSRFIVFCP